MPDGGHEFRDYLPGCTYLSPTFSKEDKKREPSVSRTFAPVLREEVGGAEAQEEALVIEPQLLRKRQETTGLSPMTLGMIFPSLPFEAPPTNNRKEEAPKGPFRYPRA